jgi:hypothetical protein
MLMQIEAAQAGPGRIAPPQYAHRVIMIHFVLTILKLQEEKVVIVVPMLVSA